jgi:hypothetical protein
VKRIITGVVDLRRKARFRSERISQLIFGEAVELLGSDGEYLRVVGPDKLEGYVLGTLVGDLEGERSYKLASRRAGDGLQLPFGSYLSEKEARRFGIPWKLLVPLEKSFEPYKLGRMFLGVPYLWGGTSDFGYDCSGFTQRLFRYSGIEIPRNSNWQRDAGQKVKDLDHARNGDLVFFRGHVAIYLGDGKIIHANLSHGGVSITDLKDRSEYSRVLMSGFQGVRRFEPS